MAPGGADSSRRLLVRLEAGQVSMPSPRSHPPLSASAPTCLTPSRTGREISTHQGVPWTWRQTFESLSLNTRSNGTMSGPPRHTAQCHSACPRGRVALAAELVPTYPQPGKREPLTAAPPKGTKVVVLK